MSVPDGSPATRSGGARALVVVAMATLLAASTIGSFRADDWENLERGQRVLTSGETSIWTSLNQYGFYRPLVDLWHGVMMQLWGLRPWPHLVPLILLLTLQTFLLARIARLRGGSPALGWLVAAAAWAQVNTYAWTALWPANATGGLMTTFFLLALLMHHRAVRQAGDGRGFGPSVALAAVSTALALISKEEAVVLPAVLAWLEALRWRRLGSSERRAALTSWILVSLLVAGFIGVRVVLMPVAYGAGQYYALRFGMNWLLNLAFFAVHLGALPILAAALTLVLYPAAWRREARQGEDWARAREGMLAGLGWAAIGIQIFLPVGGRAYGYLYAPALAVAFGVAHFVEWAARVQAQAAPRAWPAARVIAAHWVVAVLATAAGLQAVGWPQYGRITREAFAVMDRTLPDPPPRAHLVFLDPLERESLSGRSLFNMVFATMPGSMVRLHYRRDDLTAEILIGPEALAAIEHPPPADAVFLARGGRLTPLPSAGPTRRDGANAPAAR